MTTVTDPNAPDVTQDVAGLVSNLVRPDEGKVRARVYADGDVFRAEIARIWRQLWLFAGHTSEVPEPGDYVTRTVGTVPLIITRQANGEVAVLINMCVHRGNLLCNYECGNSSAFKCAYHGWTYRNNGELLGVPYQTAYGDDFDKSSLGLHRPARVGEYRGFIFVSHSAQGPALEDHLGQAREALDRFIDLSPTGRLRFDAGYHRIRLDANWKMYVENASDNYHANFVHVSAFMSEEQRKTSAAISRDASKAIVRALGGGHTDIDFRPEQRAQGAVLRTGNATAVDTAAEERYMADLSARLGEQEARDLVSGGPPTLYIFPNMFIIQQDVRRLEPVSYGRCCLYQHPAMLDGAPESINEQRLARHEAAYGPAGFVMPDDLEVFSRNQRAVEAAPDDWLLLARGLHREQVADGGWKFSHVTDETGMRGMWRTYVDLMSAAS